MGTAILECVVDVIHSMDDQNPHGQAIIFQTDCASGLGKLRDTVKIDLDFVVG